MEGGAVQWGTKVEMAAVRQRHHHRPFRLGEPTGVLCWSSGRRKSKRLACRWSYTMVLVKVVKVAAWLFSAFVTPATPRTPVGDRACGTPRRMGGLVFRPRLIRRCPRICAIFAAYVGTMVNFNGSCYKKMPRAGAAGAEQTAREKRRRPSPQCAAVAGVCLSGHGGCFKLHQWA